MRELWLNFRRIYYADNESASAIYGGIAWLIAVVIWCALVAVYIG